jgi:nucleotide-binding universal stress UspA family protein
MDSPGIPMPVVVGIDGSRSALHAAEWAADEAASRDIPLRLIHVIASTATDIHQETAAAEEALRTAHAAVNGTGQPVEIESTIEHGPVAATLAAESTSAAMLCVGSVGSGHSAPKYLGAVATAVAELAQCQVAIIRNFGDARWSESDDIAVVIDDSPDIEAVFRIALDEARLRNATLLIVTSAMSPIGQGPPDRIDRRLADWLRRYPDVQTRNLLVPNDIPAFLAEHDPPVQLTIMSRCTGNTVTRLIGYYGRLAPGDTGCSVLLAGR